VGACAGPRLGCLASRLREWARAGLRRHVLPGVQQGLVRAMVIGDRSGLDPETAEAFRRAGTYHVLALSGAQVALLAGLLVALAKRLELGLLPSALGISCALLLYALVVGNDVPVLRAAVMGSVLLLGRGLDLDGDLANLLGLAALLLLAAHPSSVGDVGFRLSFAATLAIVLIAPALARPLASWPLGTGGLLAGSVAAQAALLPVLAVEFHRVSPAPLVLNLAAVPLSGAVLLLGVLVLALSTVSAWLATAAGHVAFLAADLLLRTCDGGGLAEACDWRAPALALPVLLPWGFGLVALRRGRWGRGLLLMTATGSGLVLGAGPRAEGRLEVSILDVGQGDAIVVRSPSGRAVVVDAGLQREGFDLGERIVAPYLWAFGLRRLDRLVVTHAHPDHAGGAPFLARVFRPAEVWEGIAPSADPSYRTLDHSLLEAEVTRISVARGHRVSWDGVDFVVLGPVPGPPPATTRNDDSVVLLVRYGKVCFLLTGDVEARGERQVAAPPCDVLKVAHHGSRTSTSQELLTVVRPRVAVVSAGYQSRFGHPHPEVLLRLARAGALVRRTDLEGTVRLLTDGQRLWAEPYFGGPAIRLR
jgi:competence protein ComEC